MRCWLHRLRRARHEVAAREWPESMRRHLDTCAPCRAAWEAERAVHERLARATRGPLPEPSPRLRNRIRAAVQEAAAGASVLASRPSDSCPATSGEAVRGAGSSGASPHLTHPLNGLREWGWLRRWTVVGAGCAVLLLAVLPWIPTPSPAIPPAVATNTTSPAQWLARIPEPLNLSRMGTVLDQPLLDEGRFVLEDARSAVEGIALRLLPSGMSLEPWFAVR